MIDILLPELGEGISNVEIRDVLVKKGDSIKKDQVILVLETDKASMEIPSEHDGPVWGSLSGLFWADLGCSGLI